MCTLEINTLIGVLSRWKTVRIRSPFRISKDHSRRELNRLGGFQERLSIGSSIGNRGGMTHGPGWGGPGRPCQRQQQVSDDGMTE